MVCGCKLVWTTVSPRSIYKYLRAIRQLGKVLGDPQGYSLFWGTFTNAEQIIQKSILCYESLKAYNHHELQYPENVPHCWKLFSAFIILFYKWRIIPVCIIFFTYFVRNDSNHETFLFLPRKDSECATFQYKWNRRCNIIVYMTQDMQHFSYKLTGVCILHCHRTFIMLTTCDSKQSFKIEV